MATVNIWPTTSIGLLNQLKNLGDAEAWERFYSAYRPLVENMGRRKGLQPADVDDVTQQVLMAVSRQMSNFEYDPQKGRFRGWLATVTARGISRRWKSIARQGLVATSELELESAAAEADFLEEFHEALLETARETVKARVEPREWAAFEQISEQNVPARQIAEQFGMSLSWVYRVKFKLLDLLTQEVVRLSDDVAFIHK